MSGLHCAAKGCSAPRPGEGEGVDQWPAGARAQRPETNNINININITINITITVTITINITINITITIQGHIGLGSVARPARRARAMAKEEDLKVLTIGDKEETVE